MTNSPFYSPRKKVSGSAIGITMLTIAALLTISLGMARIVPRDFRDTIDMENSLTAEMTAWSGVEHGLYLVRNAKKENKFFELSASYQNDGNAANRPFGKYDTSALGGAANCLLDRTACPALDRALGQPVNQQPVKYDTVLAAPDTSYGLVVWHRRQDVGNPSDSVYDSITDNKLKATRTSTNINPILERDEVRRLDIRGTQSITVKWQPIESSNCKTDSPTRFWLVGTTLSENNEIINRSVSKDPPYQLSMNGAPNAAVLSLRFLVTTDRDKENDISDCFIRYSMVNSGGETNDLGYDVVESTGKSGGIQRKLRVQVDRENGRPLNIFDFGIACQFCEGIQ